MDSKEVKDKKDEEEPVYGTRKAGRDFLCAGDYGLDESVAWDVEVQDCGRMLIHFTVRAEGETTHVCKRWTSGIDIKDTRKLMAEQSEKLDTLMRHCLLAKAAMKEGFVEVQRIWDDRYLNNTDH